MHILSESHVSEFSDKKFFGVGKGYNSIEVNSIYTKFFFLDESIVFSRSKYLNLNCVFLSIYSWIIIMFMSKYREDHPEIQKCQTGNNRKL